MKQQTPPQVGDRVEAFSPQCRSWLKVTVTRRTANSFWGEDKDFQKWTGLKNWRPWKDEPEAIPQNSEKPTVIDVWEEIDPPLKQAYEALTHEPQALIVLAVKCDRTGLATLKALRLLKDRGLAKELPDGWVLTRNGYAVTRPDSWFNPPEKKDYAPEPDGQLNLLEEAQPDNEPPEPDDFPTVEAFTEAWKKWEEEGGIHDTAEEEYAHVTPDQIWRDYKDCKRHTVGWHWDESGTPRYYCPYCNEDGEVTNESIWDRVKSLSEVRNQYIEISHSNPKRAKEMLEAVAEKDQQILAIQKLLNPEKSIKSNPPEPEEKIEPIRGHLEKYYVEKRTKNGELKRYEYHHLVYWDFDKKQEVKRHIPSKELGKIQAGINERLRREHEDSMRKVQEK